MNPIVLTRAEDLDAHLGDTVVIGFFGAFSALSEQARPAFEAFAQDAEAPVVLVDVGAVKGVHKRFDVASVPAAVTVADGQVIRRASGLHDAEGWARALLPHAGLAASAEEGPRFPSVVVYTSPTCVWCDRVKRFLDDKSVPYREIDVSKDTRAADELVKRSGQMGVPQVDIAGQIIVGFDKPRIERLLGLKAA